MGFSAMVSRAVGYLVKAADWNQVKTNFDATGVGIVTTKGDLTPASASQTLVRMAAGSDYDLPYYLASQSGGLATGSAGRKWLISDTELSSAAASIDLTSIPATYTNLELEYSLRGDTVAQYIQLYIRFNNISTNTYDAQAVQHANATTTQSAPVAQAQWYPGVISAASASPGLYSHGRIIFPDYADTNTQQTGVMLGHEACFGTANTSQSYHIGYGTMRSSGALSRITLWAATGNLAQYSRVCLYGIR